MRSALIKKARQTNNKIKQQQQLSIINYIQNFMSIYLLKLKPTSK